VNYSRWRKNRLWTKSVFPWIYVVDLRNVTVFPFLGSFREDSPRHLRSDKRPGNNTHRRRTSLQRDETLQRFCMARQRRRRRRLFARKRGGRRVLRRSAFFFAREFLHKRARKIFILAKKKDYETHMFAGWITTRRDEHSGGFLFPIVKLENFSSTKLRISRSKILKDCFDCTPTKSWNLNDKKNFVVNVP